ncbi:MAG: xanthine dehydrogenase family protein molybdopterin-binding subunit [Alphaproteobacteria bacterium]
MGPFGIGQPVRRREDVRLLTGQGQFLDDRDDPNIAHAHLLRSPHAHARIRAIDTSNALACPGVLAVATAADLARDGLSPIPSLYTPSLPAGSPFNQAPQPILADGVVRFVGEPVVLIVAETRSQAEDAAETIKIDYEALAPVTATAAALDPAAPRLHAGAPANRSYRFEAGDAAATEAAFAKASRVVTLSATNNRIIINAIEPRAALGLFDPKTERFTLHTNSQVPHRFKALLADHLFHLPADRFRIVIGDVGGGFGAKNQFYPEQALVLWAARQTGRPVKWIGTNSEGCLTDIQGRDNVSTAELALDTEGRFLGLKVRTIASLGAYLANMGALIPTSGVSALAGVYRTPAIHVVVDAVFANMPRTDAYRGAGRPEANYLLERLIDHAAREMGLDPAALRRRNMLSPSELPHTTPFGTTYDVGDFPRQMSEALRHADADGFPARRADSERRGKLRGLGFASIVERSGGGGLEESSEIRFNRDGGVTVLSGMMDNGQGHGTTFAQIVAEKLGLAFDRVTIVQGDTDVVRTGIGTAGSRSLVLGGSSLFGAIERALVLGEPIAAHLLEAAEADIRFERGHYRIVGTDRLVPFADVVRASFDPRWHGTADRSALDNEARFKADFSYPSGCHVAEVEVDPDTGLVTLERYTVAHDSGVVLNPMIVEGQLHGGLAQGVGQALLEEARFNGETGQPLTGTLMDYALPRASDLPPFDIVLDGVPTATNPLGVKGCGESGASGSPPAVMNALLDALAPLGIRHIDMPATPERVWQAIHTAGRPPA